MNKASLLASAAIASVALAAAPAFAQQAPASFADVPTDHWAYASVEKLRDAGIVIGYPDGTYGGKRAMTRYEFAVAIARLLDKVGTGAQPIDAYTKAEADALFAKKSDLAGFATKADVDELRRLVDEFKNELATLGQQINTINTKLADLEKRVSAIEEELKRVKISGTVNFLARGNHRSSTDVSVPGGGEGGTGVRNASGTVDANGFAVASLPKGGILQDTRVLHDIDLKIKARLASDATAEAIINFGNYLPYLNSIAYPSGVRTDFRNPAVGGLVNQDQAVTVYKATVDVPFKLLGAASGLTIGRMPFQLTPYTFKQIDVDYYSYNEKTDLGDIPVDGGKLDLRFGSVGITGFAAKIDPIRYVSNLNGVIGNDMGYGLYAGAARPFTANVGGGFRGNSVATVDPLGNAVATGNRPTQVASIGPSQNGAMSVEQMAGGRLTFGLGRVGTIGGTFLAMSGRSTGAPAPAANDANFAGAGSAARILADKSYFDQVLVYGADFNGALGPVLLNASYTKSDTYGSRVEVQNGQTVIDTDSEKKTDEDNDALDLNAGIKFGSVAILGGYREIAPYFSTPGNWLRLGAFQNPTDIKGPYAKLDWALGGNVSVLAEGHWYEGTGDAIAQGGLSSDDKINNYKAGVKFGIGSASNIDLGVEYTQYEVVDGFGANAGGRGKPEEWFYNIGYGYSFNPTTSLRLLYQIIDYKDKGTGFDLLNGKGGVGAVQFSVKF
ncbi:MAG TPA: S-layer homology domain-containing protein [Armatimonadaceae bacterium]|nr:S-layer homology domain-containing protein [Armatimonadaceae bacterium]